MPDWTVSVDVGVAPPEGEALALDVDPRALRVTLAPRPMGLGSAEVGQRVIYRVFYEGAATAGAAAWLAGADAAALLDAVVAGYKSWLTWSGDPMGEWSEAALVAVEALAQGVDAALDAG